MYVYVRCKCDKAFFHLTSNFSGQEICGIDNNPTDVPTDTDIDTHKPPYTSTSVSSVPKTYTVVIFLSLHGPVRCVLFLYLYIHSLLYIVCCMCQCKVCVSGSGGAANFEREVGSASYND